MAQHDHETETHGAKEPTVSGTTVSGAWVVFAIIGAVFALFVFFMPLGATDGVFKRFERMVPVLCLLNTIGIAYLCARDVRRG